MQTEKKPTQNHTISLDTNDHSDTLVLDRKEVERALADLEKSEEPHQTDQQSVKQQKSGAQASKQTRKTQHNREKMKASQHKNSNQIDSTQSKDDHNTINQPSRNEKKTSTEATSIEQDTQHKLSTPDSDTTLTPVKRNESKVDQKPFPKVGTVLKNRFKLVELIGDGGMSQVFKARDLRLEAAGAEQPFVAIKIISREFKNLPEALSVMARECQKTRELSHPNIVKVFDYDNDDGVNFISMELLEGESLDKVIQRAKPRGLSLEGALSIIDPICKALNYAHSQGVVHADLKPSNIFVTRSGEIKIFDFGVVRVLSKTVDQYAASVAETDSNPKTGGYTPAYASLEMLNGEEPDLRDDLYALGCIAYELISSRHPYNRTPANQIEVEKTPLVRPKKIGMMKWKVLRETLSLAKEERPETAQKFLDRFNFNWLSVGVKASLGVATMIILATYSANFYRSYQDVQNAHNIELSKSNLFSNLNNSDKAEIIESYRNLSNYDEVYQLAFMRKFQSEIIEDYYAQIQSNRTYADKKYPDFVAQLKIVNEVEGIFKDSKRVEKIKQDILTSRDHMLKAKEHKFNNLLLLTQYQPSDDGEDVYALLTDMRNIKPGFDPTIPDEALELYSDSVQKAIKEQNYELVESLLSTGKTIFPENPQYLKLVGKGDEYHNAAKKLKEYTDSQSTDEPLTFPYSQATIFYAELIAELNKKVNQADGPVTLDEVFTQVVAWSDKLPRDFRPLDDTRKQLSSKYMSNANKMMSKRMIKTASPLFEKAEFLLSYN